MGVEERLLEAMLTERVVVTRREKFVKQLRVVDAEFTRDAIVKSLYEVRGNRRAEPFRVRPPIPRYAAASAVSSRVRNDPLRAEAFREVWALLPCPSEGGNVAVPVPEARPFSLDLDDARA